MGGQVKRSSTLHEIQGLSFIISPSMLALLHPPRYPMTAAVLRTAVKETYFVKVL
jgi:hypothetical protein